MSGTIGTNSQTEHSRNLRKETSAKRRELILYEGGLDFRALLEREHVLKLEILMKQQRYVINKDKPATKASLLRNLIDDAYNQLSMESKNDQLDLL